MEPWSNSPQGSPTWGWMPQRTPTQAPRVRVLLVELLMTLPQCENDLGIYPPSPFDLQGERPIKKRTRPGPPDDHSNSMKFCYAAVGKAVAAPFQSSISTTPSTRPAIWTITVSLL